MSGAANQGTFGQGPGWFQDDRAYCDLVHLAAIAVAATMHGFHHLLAGGSCPVLLAIWNRRLGRLLFGGGPRRHALWLRMGRRPGRAWKHGLSRPHGGRSSGNQAFDEYRAETLRRLEEEQAEFASFLDRLRFAKDKAEFDRFMAERRRGRPPPGQSRAVPPKAEPAGAGTAAH